MINEVFVRPMKPENTHHVKGWRAYNDAVSENILDILEISEKTKANDTDVLNRHSKNGIKEFDTRRSFVEYKGDGYAQNISVAILDPSLANDGPRKQKIEELVNSGVTRILYAKKSVYANKSFDKKLKNQIKKSTKTTTAVAVDSASSNNGSGTISSSSGSVNTTLSSNNTNVNKKTDADYSLDVERCTIFVPSFNFTS